MYLFMVVFIYINYIFVWVLLKFYIKDIFVCISSKLRYLVVYLWGCDVREILVVWCDFILMLCFGGFL